MNEEYESLLAILEQRFQANPARHPSLEWRSVQPRLVEAPGMLKCLLAMETSGGQPDVVTLDTDDRAIVFCDCSPESPIGRRSLCYDQAALETRKEHKPAGSACGFAAEIGAELLTEAQYRRLQTLGAFDQKTSSWLKTPEAIRQRGGALFGDRRYDHVFIYHNGAESYYGVRGFRLIARLPA